MYSFPRGRIPEKRWPMGFGRGSRHYHQAGQPHRQHGLHQAGEDKNSLTAKSAMKRLIYGSSALVLDQPPSEADDVVLHIAELSVEREHVLIRCPHLQVQLGTAPRQQQ